MPDAWRIARKRPSTILGLGRACLRRLGVPGVEQRHARLGVIERDRFATVPARVQEAVRGVDDYEGEAGVRQERSGLFPDEAVGLPREDAHRRDLVDRCAEFALALVLGHVD